MVLLEISPLFRFGGELRPNPSGSDAEFRRFSRIPRKPHRVYVNGILGFPARNRIFRLTPFGSQVALFKKNRSPAFGKD